MPTDPETGKFTPAPSQRTLPAEDDPAELDAAAEVSDEDIDRAADYGRKADETAGGLIDAGEYKES